VTVGTLAAMGAVLSSHIAVRVDRSAALMVALSIAAALAAPSSNASKVR
jgi:hypothetical protein